VKVIIRADSGFARDEIMSWCEENRVDYVLGLAHNPRLIATIKRELVEVAQTRIGGCCPKVAPGVCLRQIVVELQGFAGEIMSSVGGGGG
jgi:hypothetical protein